MSKSLTTNEFINKANIIHNNKYCYDKVNYISSHTKVIIVCLIHGEFEQKPNTHLNGHGCSKCSSELSAKKRTSTTSAFIEKAIKIHGNKYKYNKVKYISAKSKVKIFCNLCNIYFMQEPANHLNGVGCPECSKKLHIRLNTKTIEHFIQKAKTIHENKYDYSLSVYTKSNNKVKIICNQCKNIFSQIASNHLNGQGCPICKKKSSGEASIRYFLIENNINFEEQKRFLDCKNKNPLPFDFYLPDYNLLIEYDGIQHFIGKSFSSDKSEETKLNQLSYTQKNDNIKNKYCITNEFKLLRISYLNFNKIEEILISLLLC